MCDTDAGLSTTLQTALDQWAAENGCSCIDIENDTQFVRVWMFCLCAAVGFCTLVTLPICWMTKTKQPKEIEESVSPAKSDNKSDAWVDVEQEEEDGPAPDVAKAKLHLRKSSATVDGKWRPVFGTGLSQMAEIGGTGTDLYFRLLRNLGICFIYMAAVTCVSTAFNAASNFAPDNGQMLAKTTIGNVGAVLKNGDLPPNERYIILKFAGGCQGVPVTKLTALLGWLDLVSVLIFLTFIAVFRFVLIPKVAAQSDEEQVTPKDFSVMIDKLPRSYPGMEEILEDGRTRYEADLSELLCARIEAMRSRELKGIVAEGVVSARVEEMVLVRDYKGRLDMIRKNATLAQEKDIAEYCKEAKKAANLAIEIDKLKKSLEKKLKPEAELPVVRAYAILSTSKDAGRLLTDFRFSAFHILRVMQQCLGLVGCFECMCPQRQRLFKGRAIRVRNAPEPSNILWENQDVPWIGRVLRRCLIFGVFMLIVLLSFSLVYAANFGAKSNMKSNAQIMGSSTCDPDVATMTSGDSEETEYICYVNNATAWTRDFLESEASDDQKGCYCGTVGYAEIMKDASLYNGICKDWLISVGKGMSIGVGCTLIVVIINVVCKATLLALASVERPLSESALNSSKMVKIWALQTLNTGFVIFCVNYSPPDALSGIKFIFSGEYNDSTRGWYAIVGAAVLTNMAANAITPAATNIGVMIVNKIMRLMYATRVKHHAQLLKLYTNPPFDMAARFAQLLTTVYVTMAYSSGMPMLNLFAAGYMVFTYWADKIVLLRGSARPPAYDTQIPLEAAQHMLYAIPVHCVFAIWMFGQPCTFPSNPLGGALGSLSNQAQASSGYSSMGDSSGVKDRLLKESTWMIFVMLAFIIALWVIWTVLWILGGTFGELAKCLLMCVRPSKVAPRESVADALTWAQAREHIEKTMPPASYRMERHPAFRSIKSHLADSRGFRTSTSNLSNPGSPAAGAVGGAAAAAAADEPEPIATPRENKKCPVEPDVATGFLAALKSEYVDEAGAAVGQYFESAGVSDKDQEVLTPFEELVRGAADAADRKEAIREVAEKWGMQPPV